MRGFALVKIVGGAMLVYRPENVSTDVPWPGYTIGFLGAKYVLCETILMDGI